MVEWKLEVVVVPVVDVDRAVSFYRDKVGFNLDHDTRVSDEMRVVQLTPRGSACSIVLGKGIPQSEPGTIKGLQLVVRDIEPARAELVERGVEVSEIQQLDPRDGGTFVFFSDPDGNGWAVQQYRGGD
jgi:predicted enzyme related to lactoylglutathione lyase